jgi:hypothetical protein
MGLIKKEDLIRTLEVGECLVSGKKLKLSEYILSEEVFPSLYDSRKWLEKNLVLLRELVSSLVEHKNDLLSCALIIPVIDSNLEGFFKRLLSHGDRVPEYCVQCYVYLRWSSIKYENSFLKPSGDIYFTSSSLEKFSNQDSKYYRLLERIKSVANVDLVAICEVTQHIFLIEIKRASLDDRAVGQVLRYFNDTNKLLKDRVTREFNLSYIRPVLVLGDVRREYFEAFPMHFRECLDIYEYSSECDDMGGYITLKNMRKRILSMYIS